MADGSSRKKAWIWLLLYSLFVIHLSLYPWRFEPGRWKPWTGLLPETRGTWMDSVANIVLYLPFGLAAFRCFPSLTRVTLAGALLSLSMECLQMFAPYRDSSLRDLFCNTLGATLGAVTVLWAQPFLPHRKKQRLDPVEAIFFLCWVLWFTFPLIPVLRVSAVQSTWASLWHPGWPPSLFAVLDPLLGGWVLGTVLRRRPLWLLAALAVLPLQGFFLNQTFSVWRVVFAIAGSGVAALLGTPKNPVAAAGLLCLWLMARELYPFRLPDADAMPLPFSWVPFEGLLHNGQDSSYRTLFGKMFLHLSVVWGLRRALPGGPWIVPLAIPVAISFACEWMQRYLPGRTPEITEPCLSALAFLLLALAQGGGRSQSASQGE
ncbi:MAG: VanZ family protein [Acidobacteria bacterium]|nr:VanZ family protein [Acidobacteriota bacterium]